MARGGRAKIRDSSERRCIATGESRPKAGLVRFVVGPGGTLAPDLAERLPGRGIWVAAERSAIEKATSRRLFARAARREVIVSDGMADEVEKQLTRRVTELISLARKGGQAVAGYEKTKGWLMKGEAAVLLQASDGSARGKSKLRSPGGKGGLVEVLTASELGMAFGREHVIHGALAAGGLATRIVGEAARLSGLRERGSGGTAGKDKKAT